MMNSKPPSLLARLHVAALLALVVTAVAPCMAHGQHGPQWPPITEAPTDRYVPGKWVWAELFTEDAKAATRFYGEAFGWTFETFPAARGPSYTLALAVAEPVGGMLQRTYAHQKETGSRWLGFISVPDVKAAARYARANGGRVVAPPRTLAGRGEVAILADPEGAPFGVIHSATGDPPDYLAEEKQWLWIELWAKDPKAMAQFYAGLAGYEITPMERPDGKEGYFLASAEFTRCAVIPSPAPAVRSAWLPYLRVQDVKTATAQAERAGARVAVPPSSQVRDGRVALIVDPTGAPLGLAEYMETEAR
jgi:predicted enzyme related to lactoylglutathione lyase